MRRAFMNGTKCLRLLAVMVFLSGCNATDRPQYSARDATDAYVPGFESSRAYLDADVTASTNRFWSSQTSSKNQQILVISGGGAGGAFGVGVLVAWTKNGTRPSFDVVTGVSTGALIAPFAFLGPQYDDKLVHLYTSGVAETLIEPRFLPAGLFGRSLLKPGPLRNLVAQNITRDVFDAVAREHTKGRRLLVMTTNLDSQRPVVWDMGAIAASGKPNALQLFRDVLVASASIPGVYPAVMIKATSGDRVIEELHSDGGAASQFLAIPETVLTESMSSAQKRGARVNMFVLINNALMPEFETTKDSTFPVMSRAYSTLVKSQTRSALVALYGFAQKSGINFHVASINSQVAFDAFDPFATKYMRAVYRLGYSQMENGTLWKDRPIFPALSAPKDF